MLMIWFALEFRETFNLFYGLRNGKKVEKAALELRMLQVVMYDVCRVIAKFFFYYRHPRSCPDSS